MSERYEWVTATLPDGRQVTVTRYADGVNDQVEYFAQLGHHEDPRDDLPFEVVVSDPDMRVAQATKTDPARLLPGTD